MATKKDSEFEKSEDLIQEVNVGELVNAEDPVKEVILAVMKILLSEEERALVSDMNEYRNKFVSTPVESPLGAGRSTDRHGKIWA